MTVFTDGIIDTVFTGSIGDGGKNYFLFILKKKVFCSGEGARGRARDKCLRPLAPDRTDFSWAAEEEKTKHEGNIVAADGGWKSCCCASPPPLCNRVHTRPRPTCVRCPSISLIIPPPPQDIFFLDPQVFHHLFFFKKQIWCYIDYSFRIQVAIRWHGTCRTDNGHSADPYIYFFKKRKKDFQNRRMRNTQSSLLCFFLLLLSFIAYTVRWQAEG